MSPRSPLACYLFRGPATEVMGLPTDYEVSAFLSFRTLSRIGLVPSFCADYTVQLCPLLGTTSRLTDIPGALI